MKPLAIYIHVPFCASKCDYCDFISFPGREALWARYFDALKAEIAHWEAKMEPNDAEQRLLDGYEITSIFIGGGTPTLMPAEYIMALLDEVRGLAAFAPDIEISMEANPGTITLEKLAACRAAGINRLSIGAQALDDRLLKSLGRIHSTEDIAEAVHVARAAGFDDLNLDLMYALPGQDMAGWQRTLHAAIALAPEHISAYSLIVEDGTPMAERVTRGEVELPEEDLVNDMQRAAVAFLDAAGYGRYEISNYARSGRICRHNMAYWLRDDYLGLGCAAHSMLRNCRFANTSSLEDYLAGKRFDEVQRLTREDAMEEVIMLSTRTCTGLDLSKWKLVFGEDFISTRGAIIDKLTQAGLLEIADGFLRLTTRGMELQNAIVLELIQ